MATASGGFPTMALEAAGDLSTKRFLFMKFSSGQVTTCTAVTDSACGVLQNKPDAAGKAAEMIVVGETKLIAGASITAGDELTVDTSGRGVTVTPGTDTTKYILGRALEDATAAGNVIRAYVNCANPARGA